MKKINILIFFIGFILILSLVFSSENLTEKTKLIELMNKRGCIPDDILSRQIEEPTVYYNLIERLDCVYLSRAIETWNVPPDFTLISTNITTLENLTKRNYIYGINIAESIKINSQYYYPDEQRNFDFSAMCKPGTIGFWGEQTCIPSLEQSEYKKYLKYIIKQGIDNGIISFLFGQVYLQDPNWDTNPKINEIISYAKNYANSNGSQIIFGAQTNNIQKESYLKLFDYIQGGTGINAAGTISSSIYSPYVPYFQWGLLWNPAFLNKSNNVMIEFDWTSADDDMHRFAHLSQSQRASLLKDFYDFFNAKGIAFKLPVRVPLGGDPIYSFCYGYNQWVYSPDIKYSCKDELAIRCSFDPTLPITNCNYDLSFDNMPNSIFVKTAYKFFLGREAELGGYIGSMEALLYKLKTKEQLSIDFFFSNEHELLYKTQVMTNEQFMTFLYTSLFGRNPDPGGLSFYVNQLNSGTSRVEIIQGFLSSQEFKTYFSNSALDYAIFPSAGKNCYGVINGNSYFGDHNTIGFSYPSPDPRFFCYEGQFYECGWEASEPNFAFKANDGYLIGGKKCDLPNKQWINPSIPPPTHNPICSEFTERYTNTQLNSHILSWRQGTLSLTEIIKRAKLARYCN